MDILQSFKERVAILNWGLYHAKDRKEFLYLIDEKENLFATYFSPIRESFILSYHPTGQKQGVARARLGAYGSLNSTFVDIEEMILNGWIYVEDTSKSRKRSFLKKDNKLTSTFTPFEFKYVKHFYVTLLAYNFI